MISNAPKQQDLRDEATLERRTGKSACINSASDKDLHQLSGCKERGPPFEEELHG